MKQLLEQIQDDWNSLKDKLEINIIEKYACNARLFTIVVMGKNINYCDIFYDIFYDSTCNIIFSNPFFYW